ncbi:Isovaleryl-CoA dehydrogenase [Pseudonocardia sp. Ae406_Ps2]|uniref:acyl-CoA dehydrogenase family protein n=1 Tax=unclassified Pseudonocardia TaxID=2619320 RepID=UPI00094B0240|nr:MULTISPECIES: acyl-CoA dehydrogenase family protein [unclassified Pseudonocardia]OLL96882.1 Isovaleryl-CoA dehydrogenase [Pseudonocardia sp. Ae331_Ps2]OLM05407.1 Isovaleryl-CoA dehydrogenase [Pseudonocardia sp. Ae406_Ps2]OLM26977.1 Isovaleryl-CoA dehydrogenase [Pseudonocardia sp. Ae706_Ps2]
MPSSLIVADTEERAALRDAVATLVGRYGHDYFMRKAAAHEEPTELWKELGAAGFLGVHLSEAYGGGGGTMADLAVVVEESSTQGVPLLMMVISPAICGTIIDTHGSHELKSRWLPGIADGSLKMAFAITEPDAGSNSHEITTTAHPDGDDWRLRGQKYWTSGIDEADAVLVVTRAPEAGPNGRHPLSLFVVPTDTEGLTWQTIPAALQQPEHQFTVFFDDVRVGPEALIGEEGNGLRQVFAGLNPERITAACISNGIARYALEKACGYARDRQVWGVPIGSHQGVAHPLAEAYIGTQLSRLMAYRAAELYDAGVDAAEASNIAKFAAADSSLRTLDQAMQAHGGNGMSLEYGLADLWFVARMLKTAPVSREMVLNFVAQRSLGLPASY